MQCFGGKKKKKKSLYLKTLNIKNKIILNEVIWEEYHKDPLEGAGILSNFKILQ